MPSSRRFLDRQVARLQRDGSPPWWSAAQVVLGALFVLFFAWTLMAGSGLETTPPPAATPPVVQPTETTPRTDPTDRPGGTPSTADPGDGGQVKVPTTAGDKANVDQAAVAAAQAAFAAAFDPDLAETVPMAAGERFAAPQDTYPNARLGTIRVSAMTSDIVTFVAHADADGSGPDSEIYLSFTALRDGDDWGITYQQ